MVAELASEEPETAPNSAEAASVATASPPRNAGQDHARGVEQLAGQPRARRHLAHQDEQRHDRERVGRRHVERRGAGERKGGGPAVDQDVAEEADQHQRDPDRNAQQQQQRTGRQCRTAPISDGLIRRVRAGGAGFASSATSAQNIVPARLSSATIQSNVDRDRQLHLAVAILESLAGRQQHRPDQQAQTKHRQRRRRCGSGRRSTRGPNTLSIRSMTTWRRPKKRRRHAVEHEHQQHDLDGVERGADRPVEQVAHEHVERRSPSSA